MVADYSEADRPAILNLLKVHGPSNVPALAALLGVNRTAVRQQLAVLQRDGFVEASLERRRVGRPTHIWKLTAKADALFPQAYGPMALSILRQIRQMDGPEKVDRLFARRFREMAALYRERLAATPVAGRFRALARIRDGEGYMARSGPRTITEHHCPVAAIAREFPQVCAYEKRLFEAVLGMRLDRVEHLASGGRACVYCPARKATP